MKRILFFLVILGSIFGSQSAHATKNCYEYIKLDGTRKLICSDQQDEYTKLKGIIDQQKKNDAHANVPDITSSLKKSGKSKTAGEPIAASEEKKCILQMVCFLSDFLQKRNERGLSAKSGV